MTSVEAMLLGVLLLLVLLIVLVVAIGLGIRNAILRLANSAPQPPAGGTAQEGTADGAEEGPSPFEAFLAEDPSRLALTKSEQSAAYREWRRQKGMNWSNS